MTFQAQQKPQSIGRAPQFSPIGEDYFHLLLVKNCTSFHFLHYVFSQEPEGFTS